METPGMSDLEAWVMVATVVAGGVAVDAMTRMLARVHPPSYFGLSELIQGFGRTISWLGFAVRLGIPLAVGAAAGLLAGVAAGAGAGFFGALLVAWPPLVHDHLLPDGAQDRKAEVRVLYVLYAISYAALGAAGALLATSTAAAVGLGPVGRWLAATEVPSSTDILTEVVLLAVGFSLAFIARKLHERF